MILINFSWNSTPFRPKKRFSTSKTGQVINFLNYLGTQQPHNFFALWKQHFYSKKCIFSKFAISIPGETAVKYIYITSWGWAGPSSEWLITDSVAAKESGEHLLNKKIFCKHFLCKKKNVRTKEEKVKVFLLSNANVELWN